MLAVLPGSIRLARYFKPEGTDTTASDGDLIEHADSHML